MQQLMDISSFKGVDKATSIQNVPLHNCHNFYIFRSQIFSARVYDVTLFVIALTILESLGLS